MTSSGVEQFHSEAKVSGPGVVTGRYGTIGSVFLVQQDFWPLNTTLYVRDFHGNDVRFISYLLRTIDYASHSGKSGVPGVNRNDLHELSVSLPSDHAEQKAIAEALSDADALIDSLSLLLSKKRQIKQGAMQELLTGERRLPGFQGRWVECPFSSIAALRRERVSPHIMATPPRCIELEHIHAGSGRLEGQGFDSVQVATKTVFVKGDVLFGKLRAYLRKYWLAEFDGVCSTEIWALRPTGVLESNTYLFYTVQRDDLIEAASSAYGTHMPRSDWSVVGAFLLDVPEDAAEQKAIADVFSEMDASTAAIEARLAKARDMKRAMMQQLLTGRIRLVQPASNFTLPNAGSCSTDEPPLLKTGTQS